MGDLVESLRLFGEMLQRADSACAEMVEINENANDGNEPARQSVESEYQLQGGYDGVFWDICGTSRTREGLERVDWRCPHSRHRIVRVTREIIEVLDGCDHA